ncbi:MAG: hypothetical protein JNL14_14770 [Devosia sp.]|uniref:hypothetical protein n=1 Tax=Devosia sp. TaxID=1871048 RepID=UPI001A3635B6|nr:hypothetical protein [Devosia sp.]MBL8598995.1 hypothetical protein [Devosia sp.]
MWDFSIGRTLGLMGQTLPFIAFRVIVYFAVAAAFVIVTGVGAGVGWGIGAFGDTEFQAGSTAWGGVIGFGLVAGAIFFLREYVLYLVKAGHIAVLVELLDGRPIPQGQTQIGYAQGLVRERFAETNVLFAVDQIVKAVLAGILGLLQGLTALLPIPGLQNVVGIARAFLRIAVGLMDEVILGYLFRTRAANPWAGAETAVVYYAQNYKVLLKNAAWLTVITYALAFVVFLLMLAPAAALVWFIPNAWGAGGFVFALLFAWAVKAALIEPFAIAAMMDVYFRVVEGQTPDPAWNDRIGQVSRKFRDLKERAANWAGGRPLPPSAGFTAPGGPVA